MRTRHEYYLDLSKLELSSLPGTEVGVYTRPPKTSDSSVLAELMIDAYRGTIDYDGETIADAVAEIQAYFNGRRGGAPLLDVSSLAFKDGLLNSACLVAEWNEKKYPLIAYVMTRVSSKNLGLGRHLLATVLLELEGEGYREVGAVITDGNLPSERLFRSLGFSKKDAE